MNRRSPLNAGDRRSSHNLPTRPGSSTSPPPPLPSPPTTSPPPPGTATGTPITLPTHNARRGHPTIFARTLLPELLAIDEPTQGLRAILTRHPARTTELPFDDPTVLQDLNTPEDYAAARQPK